MRREARVRAEAVYQEAVEQEREHAGERAGESHRRHLGQAAAGVAADSRTARLRWRGRIGTRQVAGTPSWRGKLTPTRTAAARPCLPAQAGFGRCRMRSKARTSRGRSCSVIPRGFNMPIELGMAITRAHVDPASHEWFAMVIRGHDYSTYASGPPGFRPEGARGNRDLSRSSAWRRC